MTLAEAKAKLMAQGYEGEPTTAALILAGWEFPDPLQGSEFSMPVVTPQAVKADLARLIEEGKSASVPQNILDGLVRLGRIAVGLLLPN